MYPQSMFLANFRNLSFGSRKLPFLQSWISEISQYKLYGHVCKLYTACVCKVMDLTHSAMMLKMKKEDNQLLLLTVTSLNNLRLVCDFTVFFFLIFHQNHSYMHMLRSKPKQKLL